MQKYYLVEAIYKNRNPVLIWYFDDEQDGFLLFEQKLLTFANIDEAKLFAEKQGIILEAGITEYDFSNILELVNKIELSENCRTLINSWNFFSDLAKSLNEEFIGNSNEGPTTDIYRMLVYGANIRALNHEEYHPVFDEDDREKCVSVFRNGLSLLDKYFDI